LRSGSNADLAVDYKRVVVLAPMGSISPLGGALVKERRKLERAGASELVLDADAAAHAAFGPNPLGPLPPHGCRRSRTLASRWRDRAGG
jgi:NTE family protein